MYTPEQIPIHSATPQYQALRRHHTARYYAHRVKESLTTQISKLVCAIFLGLFLIFAIITFILWLSLRPHRPRIHVHEFSLPGLSNPTGFENAQITVNVTTRNANLNIGIFYGPIDGSIYYEDQRVGSLPLVTEPFYQEPKNTKILIGVFSGATLTVNSERWLKFMNDRDKGRVVFRLELGTKIRFKVSSWKSKWHKMHANCIVEVGSDGLILPSTMMDKKRCPVYFT